MGTASPQEDKSGAGVVSQRPFLSALFDLSFSRFLTMELIKLIYIAAIVLALVAAVSFVVAAFSNGIWTGIAGIFIAPILFLIYIVVWRVWLELLIILFRIAEYAREIAENTSILGQHKPPSGKQ